MTQGSQLTQLETLTLLSILHLGHNAYGVPIRKELEKRAGKHVSIGALYVILQQLEQRGYLFSRQGEVIKGTLPKRYYSLKALGTEALNRAHEAMTAQWEGFTPQGDRG